MEKVCLALHDAGYEVVVLARGRPGQPPEEEYRGIRILRVGTHLSSVLSTPVPVSPIWYRRIREVVERVRPDLIIAREIIFAETAARASAGMDVPLIIDMAEHYPATMRTWDKYRKNPLLRYAVFTLKIPDRVERRSLAAADGVITVCEEQSERLRGMGFPSDRMEVVGNTSDLEMFGRVRRRQSGPARVFGYHGCITRQRGLERVLCAFEIASRRNEAIQLKIFGKRVGCDGLVDVARRSEVRDRIRFCGEYRFEELPELCAGIDVGILAYPIEESIEHTVGNKLFDYVACGRPVLVTPARPLKRIVEGARCGLVTKDDTIGAIAEGMEKMSRMDLGPLSENALDISARHYHWDKDRARLLEFVGRFIPRDSRISRIR